MVKFNVAIVEPLVRFRACAVIRDSLVARISACHAGDPGSIPGLGDFLIPMFLPWATLELLFGKEHS